MDNWILIIESYLYFQNAKQMVQEGALTALASVADSSQVPENFLFYMRYLLVNLVLTRFMFHRSISKSIMMQLCLI